jgi:hypothetical protein
LKKCAHWWKCQLDSLFSDWRIFPGFSFRRMLIKSVTSKTLHLKLGPPFLRTVSPGAFGVSLRKLLTVFTYCLHSIFIIFTIYSSRKPIWSNNSQKFSFLK